MIPLETERQEIDSNKNLINDQFFKIYIYFFGIIFLLLVSLFFSFFNFPLPQMKLKAK